MIAVFWTNHHHMSLLLEKADEHLLWQNFIFLFLLSLIPFATSIVGSNPFIPIAPAIYGFVMLLTTFFLQPCKTTAFVRMLTHTDEDKELTRNIFKVSFKARTKAIVGTLFYLITIPLAYVNLYVTYACFIIPPIIFFIPEGIDNEALAERIVEKNA